MLLSQPAPPGHEREPASGTRAWIQSQMGSSTVRGGGGPDGKAWNVFERREREECIRRDVADARRKHSGKGAALRIRRGRPRAAKARGMSDSSEASRQAASRRRRALASAAARAQQGVRDQSPREGPADRRGEQPAHPGGSNREREAGANGRSKAMQARSPRQSVVSNKRGGQRAAMRSTPTGHARHEMMMRNRQRREQRVETVARRRGGQPAPRPAAACRLISWRTDHQSPRRRANSGGAEQRGRSPSDRQPAPTPRRDKGTCTPSPPADAEVLDG